jgi:hypothetical protein
MEGFTAERPVESGWYDVVFAPGERPSRVYLHAFPEIISWGWDEADDAEALDWERCRFRAAAGPD